MKTARAGNFDLIRLDPGEEILASLQQWCQDQNIANAIISGIGSVENPTLAHYRRDTKEFIEKRLPGIFEVPSISGNVAIVDGQPLVHLHVTLADAEMQAFGGHLVDGVCAATVELVVTPLPTKFTKDFDDKVGLKTWDFDAKNEERPRT